MGEGIGLGVLPGECSDDVGLQVGVVSMSFTSPPVGILTVVCGQFVWLSVSPGTQLRLLA